MLTRDINMSKIYIIVALLAIFPRLIFVFLFPDESSGDWAIYSTVAENILNGCGVHYHLIYMSVLNEVFTGLRCSRSYRLCSICLRDYGVHCLQDCAVQFCFTR